MGIKSLRLKEVEDSTKVTMVVVEEEVMDALAKGHTIHWPALMATIVQMS